MREIAPDIPYIQFVDGDCELVDGWLRAAAGLLDSRPDVGAVCGRRRERFPEKSIYNWLCDREWEGRPGEVHACGGDVMIRASALAALRLTCLFRFGPPARRGLRLPIVAVIERIAKAAEAQA